MPAWPPHWPVSKIQRTTIWSSTDSKQASIAKDIQISDIHRVTQEKTGRVNTKALKERVSGYILNLDTWLFDRIKRLEVLDSPLNPEVSDGICEPG